jgi:hypothetical protein
MPQALMHAAVLPFMHAASTSLRESNGAHSTQQTGSSRREQKGRTAICGSVPGSLKRLLSSRSPSSPRVPSLLASRSWTGVKRRSCGPAGSSAIGARTGADATLPITSSKYLHARRLHVRRPRSRAAVLHVELLAVRQALCSTGVLG